MALGGIPYRGDPTNAKYIKLLEATVKDLDARLKRAELFIKNQKKGK